MTITGFIGVYDNGDIAKVDAHGNNVAFLCNRCQHPVLAIVREHQRGSSEANPSVCQGCNESYLIEARESTKKIVIYNISNLHL